MTGRQHNGASKAPWELFFLLLLLTDRWEGCTTLAHQCARAVFVFFFILRPRRCSHQPSLGGPSLTDSRPRFTQSNIYSIVLLSVLLYHGIVLLPQKEKKGSITVDVKRIKNTHLWGVLFCFGQKSKVCWVFGGTAMMTWHFRRSRVAGPLQAQHFPEKLKDDLLLRLPSCLH